MTALSNSCECLDKLLSAEAIFDKDGDAVRTKHPAMTHLGRYMWCWQFKDVLFTTSLHIGKSSYPSPYSTRLLNNWRVSGIDTNQVTVTVTGNLNVTVPTTRINDDAIIKLTAYQFSTLPPFIIQDINHAGFTDDCHRWFWRNNSYSHWLERHHDSRHAGSSEGLRQVALWVQMNLHSKSGLLSTQLTMAVFLPGSYP